MNKVKDILNIIILVSAVVLLLIGTFKLAILAPIEFAIPILLTVDSLIFLMAINLYEKSK